MYYIELTYFKLTKRKKTILTHVFVLLFWTELPVIKSKKPEHTKRITPPKIWGLQKDDRTEKIIGAQKSASVVFNYEHMVDYKEWGGREGESYVCISVYSSTRLVVKVNTNNNMRLYIHVHRTTVCRYWQNRVLIWSNRQMFHLFSFLFFFNRRRWKLWPWLKLVAQHNYLYIYLYPISMKKERAIKS